MTLAISHSEHADGGEIGVLDLVREVRPPFSPDAVAIDFCDISEALSHIERHWRSLRRRVVPGALS